MTQSSFRPGNGNYDLAVIGAGSAGFSAAITAAEQGAKVALIGHGMIGGTCVNVGCVPSKTMIRAAEGLHHTTQLSRFGGMDGKAAVTDWQALMAKKDALVGELQQAKYIDVLPAYNNIAYLEGRARFHDGAIRVDLPVDADCVIGAGEDEASDACAADSLQDVVGAYNIVG